MCVQLVEHKTSNETNEWQHKEIHYVCLWLVSINYKVQRVHKRNERELSDLHASNHNLMFNLCVFFSARFLFLITIPTVLRFHHFLPLARAPWLRCATCGELRCTLFALHLFLFTVCHYNAAAISVLSPNNFIFTAHSMHRNNFERI